MVASDGGTMMLGLHFFFSGTRRHTMSYGDWSSDVCSSDLVQGTRDSLCPLDLLEELRSQMKASNFLHLVKDEDHSLRLTKRGLQAAGETQEDVDGRIVAADRKSVV